MQNSALKKRIEKLSPEEKYITQEKGTEAPFSGKYNDYHEKGVFSCKVCGALLFNSENKFDSSSGWPSFDRVSSENNIEEHEDNSLSIKRTEVLCKKCGSHLGHVFDDGPKETTGKRYCINSISLDFKKKNI